MDLEKDDAHAARRYLSGVGDQPAQATARHRLQSVLEAGGEHTLRTLSQQTSLSERDVAEHLVHLERSLTHRGLALVIEPARCRECGFRFERRSRATRPSRCPRCRSERIDPARFALRGKEG